MSQKIKILVINGPNLNMLGEREPDRYGKQTWEEISMNMKEIALDLGIELFTYQSNCEGTMIDFIQEQGRKSDGIVINPAALSFAGYAVKEAILAVKVPYIEIHMTNIFNREAWHAKSVFSSDAQAVFVGMKGKIYGIALRAMHDFLTDMEGE